jgi:hypothetical protein
MGVGGVDSKISYYWARAVRGGALAADAPAGAAAGCEAAKAAAQAAFALCRLKAEALYTKTADATKRDAAEAACATKLVAAYAKAEATYPGACAVADDVDDVRAYHEAAAARLVDWTAGRLTAPFTFERLAATGQTRCWLGASIEVGCDGTGQDGDAQAGAAPDLVDGGDGTITDRNTGLQWEKKSDDGSLHDKDDTYPWVGKCTADGKTWCTRDADCLLLGGTCGGTTVFEWVDQLNAAQFAGHDDWRVPNIRELESIVSHGVESSSAPYVPAAFDTNCGSESAGNPGCTVTDCSCTRPFVYRASTTLDTMPSFAYGLDFARGTASGIAKTATYYAVRAVRGGS